MYTEKVIKEEKVGYLKSKVNMLQGVIRLTEDDFQLQANKTGVGGFGLLGSLLKRKVESKNYGFSVPLAEIQDVKQGKHGVNNNVLEVLLKNGELHRILVKNYQEWADALKN